MATARRLPLAFNVSTHGDGTRNYTSVLAWEAATRGNLVSATMGEVLDCYDDAGANEDQQIRVRLSTTDANYFRVVRAAPGQEHDGTPNNGVRFHWTDANGRVVRNEEDYCGIYDLIISSTRIGAVTDRSCIELNADNCSAVGCIIDRPTNDDVAAISAIESTSTGTTFAIDNIAIGGKGRSHFYNSGSGTLVCYNNTSIDSPNLGYEDNAGTLIATNGISQGSTGNGYSATVTTTTCISDDATGDIQATLTFANAGSDDYHLAASDTAAIGAGTDLSADATYAFDDDIDRQTFTPAAWDIGADAFTAPPVVAPTANDDVQATPVDDPVAFNILNNDTAGDNPIDPASVDLDPGTGGQQTTYVDTGKGTYTVDALGNVTFTPEPGFDGVSTAQYTVDDTLGNTSNIANITVTVFVSLAPDEFDGVIVFTAKDQQVARPLNVQMIRWVNPTASTNAEFTEVDGVYGGDMANVVWDAHSAGTEDQESLTNGFYFQHGMRCSVLESGEVYVYLVSE